MGSKRCVPAVLLATMAATLAAQTSEPTFDVASIKERQGSTRSPIIDAGPYGLRVTNATVLDVIQFAFDLPKDRVVGELPDWVGRTRFDVEAKAESGPVPQARMRAMTRALLTDRFRLKVSSEQTVMPVYALVVTRSDGSPGPGLIPSKSRCSVDAPYRSVMGAAWVPQKEQKEQKESEPPVSRSCGFGVGTTGSSLSSVAGSRVTMDRFAIILSRYGEYGRPVIDRTGLVGEFDFAFPTVRQLSAPRETRFIIGLQEELGLTLRAEQGPVEMLRVHHIEPPSPN